MQRGEAEGRTTTNLRALFGASPKGAADFNVILQAGLRKAPDQPDVPLMRDLARNSDQKVVLDFISRTMSLGRPVATNQNVPQERVAILRKAFDATMRDREFLADARKQNLDISPWTGAELQQIVLDIVDTPASSLGEHSPRHRDRWNKPGSTRSSEIVDARHRRAVACPVPFANGLAARQPRVQTGLLRKFRILHRAAVSCRHRPSHDDRHIHPSSVERARTAIRSRRGSTSSRNNGSSCR